MPRGEEPWTVYGRLRDPLPAAREYWLVFRSESASVPPPQIVSKLTRSVAEIQQQARHRGLRVAGIQLDVDSPTRALAQYATFLREVRKGLDPGVQISITALLDWFRPGTSVGEVITAVDEFVPQFYDVNDRDSYRGGTAIAARFVAARWDSVFNQYRKRFRIGISTFGRSRLTRGQYSTRYRQNAVVLIGNIKPLDLAVDPAFDLQTSRTDADELVLSYRATRWTRIDHKSMEAGDAVEFVLPTPESISAAVEQVKLVRGHCAGVVFFRWPALNDTLAVQPDEVLRAAGLITRQEDQRSTVKIQDGSCASVHCVDLFLVNAPRRASKPIRYRIASSTELEYFLPSERVPVRMSGPSQIELSLPPYCGQRRLYLGRAVTAKRAEFTMEDPR